MANIISGQMGSGAGGLQRVASLAAGIATHNPMAIGAALAPNGSAAKNLMGVADTLNKIGGQPGDKNPGPDNPGLDPEAQMGAINRRRSLYGPQE